MSILPVDESLLSKCFNFNFEKINRKNGMKVNRGIVSIKSLRLIKYPMYKNTVKLLKIPA